MKPKSVYMQKLNDTVTFHCVAHDKQADIDRTLITWTRRDGILPINRHSMTEGNLTIQNITAGLLKIS